MKCREIFSSDINFDFLGKRKYFLTLSLLMMIGSFVVWFQRGDGRYGIDFSGGLDLLVSIPAVSEAEMLRGALAKGGWEEAVVQPFEGKPGQYSIRIGKDSERLEGASQSKRGVESLKGADLGEVELLSSEFVGPVVGKELQRKALYATIFGLLGVMLYLKIRFEYAFAFGAVMALLHDVLFSFGVYLWLGFSINMETLAAVLTIIGYSVNDTIVIFDRVREEIFEGGQANRSLSGVVNLSINAMLSRTLITHMLTFVTIIALLVFGSGAIYEMSVFLVAGMVSGSYSTMYIASPCMIWWHKLMGGTEEV